MCTRSEFFAAAPRSRGYGGDPAELVALVAAARRELLLRVHRHRLRREDLEECFAEATLELIAAARRGRRFESGAHAANALEQRFLARVLDRRRALAGRSAMQAAIEHACPLQDERGEPIGVADPRADTERVAIAREELRRICAAARELSADQRAVLASQVATQATPGSFCRTQGWSPEKYRKVAQRGRARLRELVEAPVPAARAASERTVGTRL